MREEKKCQTIIGTEMIMENKTIRKNRSSIHVNNDLPLNPRSVVSKEPRGQSGP